MVTHLPKQLVHIPADAVTLEGELLLPPGAQGVVVFAHGSGSRRHSSRNTFVAGVLQSAELGTLLFDLLTRAEDTNYGTRFDTALLTRRLVAATHWLQQQPQTKMLAIGYFGASTGAAAALEATAVLGTAIKAVVSRGGRPDLAGPALARVQTPTLLIVGGEDHEVMALNRHAYAQLRGEKQLVIVPGATHLFEEPGTLEEVARLASRWFTQHLCGKQMEKQS
ncbi:MAG: dienelactone hydrolase family protein [Deltaproteobacteria bacterium]|nr:dienelactone hydrolase family protein [Deltaproteobacteria bacterium]